MLLAISTFGWVLLGALYLVLLISLGVMSVRKGHWVLFILGFFFPLLWVIGALMPPTAAAEESAEIRQ